MPTGRQRIGNTFFGINRLPKVCSVDFYFIVFQESKFLENLFKRCQWAGTYSTECFKISQMVVPYIELSNKVAN